MNDNQTTLVLGGARSGKSSYAESRAEIPSLQRTYIATAQVWDEEMSTRVKVHSERRGADWITVEEPIRLADAIDRHCREDAFVLVDCMTLWLTNIMLAEMDTDAEIDHLLNSVSKAKGQLVVVSNEVGYGIVPENALARRFRDAAGLLNQRLAKVCDEVVLVAAGLPLTLKA